MAFKILNTLFSSAERHKINLNDKLIIFSDCHRGDNSYADDFSHNKMLYKHALFYYLQNNYTYYELGDGIELWENRYFKHIFEAHKESFLLLKKFHSKKRMHLLFGNHDAVFKDKNYTKKHLEKYVDTATSEEKVLFKDVKVQEAIVLEFENHNKSIFLIHGHQADWFNYHFWKLSRFLVRNLWIPLQRIGVKDPTSPAKNFKELIKVEQRLKDWCQENNQMIIAGHTHRPRFPESNDIPYFNDGSCVHPRSITGIEIANHQISLIKWHQDTDNPSKILKSIIEGPKDLGEYLK